MIHNCCYSICHTWYIIDNADKDYHHTHSHTRIINPNTHIVDSIIWCCGFVIIEPNHFTEFIRCSARERMNTFVWWCNFWKGTRIVSRRICAHDLNTEQTLIGRNVILIVQNSYPFIAGRNFFSAAFFLCYLESFTFESHIKWKIREGNLPKVESVDENTQNTLHIYTESFWCLFPFLSEMGAEGCENSWCVCVCVGTQCAYTH